VLLREGDHCPHVGLDRHVGQDESGAAAVRLDLAHGLCAAMFIYVSDDDRRALACQSHRYRAANAGTGTCNECNFILHVNPLIFNLNVQGRNGGFGAPLNGIQISHVPARARTPTIPKAQRARHRYFSHARRVSFSELLGGAS
jgi:hypothetical protein